ncbi:DUF4276 family protein [Candidatus Poribacteria bacterium]|nr:DUF4276 family protein [Candidatus Poribacteria bacterium]
MRSRKTSRKIMIYCEGDTEEDNLKPLLDRYTEECRLQIRNLGGVGQVKRKIGAVTENQLRPQTGVIAVFALVDLYGSGFDTVAKVKADLRRRVPPEYRDRFHPHVAVHEIEAWIFAVPQVLNEWLGTTIKPFPNPETINLQNPPAKLLEELTRRHKQSKVPTKRVMAQRLFAKISSQEAYVNEIYSKCKHFKAFVDDLRQTARR